MWNITRRNLAANKVRLALTALAIVLGVGFITSANVLSDGLRASFGNLAEEINQGIDLQVTTWDNPLGEDEVQTIIDTDGVRSAEGRYVAENEVLPLRTDGTIVEPEGPPVIAISWTVDDQLNQASIETGRAPTGPAEWVVDRDTAANEGFVVGERYRIVVPTTEGFTEAELVGTFRFGADNQTNGAVLMAFDAAEAKDLFVRSEFDEIVVATNGQRQITDVRNDIEAGFGTEYTVSDSADLNAQTTAEFNSFIDSFAWVLRGFAIIALFVSIFIIANTFNIVMGQRVRELGLLRAVGATPKQVRQAVLGEAVAIGLIASVIGLGVGVGLAYGVEAALNALGAELPEFGKPLTLATALIGLGVGVVVTALSAWAPARKAGRIPPVTAIAGHEGLDNTGGRRSIILGVALVLLGAVLTGVSLFGGIDSTAMLLSLLGIGAALLFIGITLVSPLFAAPIARTIGAPIAKLYRRPGTLAKENAARNPKRTATTAAALMIGLSLVSMAFVVGQTLKSDLNELLETTVQADYAAFSETFAGLPTAVADDMAATPELENVTGFRYWSTEVTGPSTLPEIAPDGTEYTLYTEVGTLPLGQLDAVLDLDLQEGSYSDITDNSLAIQDDVAATHGVGLGDQLTVMLADESTIQMEVAAIFADSNIFEGVLVTETRWDTIGEQENFDWVAATIAEGTTSEQADAAMASIAERYPQIEAQSAADYRAEISGEVDNLLYILTGFLGLAIVIAFIGIVNTMALSIFERTRELGLLRAVGMTRGQMHRMVRWEAAIVSAVGALLGAAVGIVFGVLVVNATPEYILDNLSIPWLSLAGLVGVATIAGLVAGFLPARRAGKLDVLQAIAG